MDAEFPDELADAIRDSYNELCRRHNTENASVEARSNATAAGLPEASFAGQQEA
jgi:pyruvate,water dikinase